MTLYWISAILCFLSLSASCVEGWATVPCGTGGAFATRQMQSKATREKENRRQRHGERLLLLSTSSEEQDATPGHFRPSDLYLVSWDGCLVDTCPRNREYGLEAAYRVWPDLQVMTEGADLTWLMNKVEALQHVLAPRDSSFHPAVEYGLAMRMLLEEQELDLGNSNGSKGKYGSRFHPSEDCEAFPKVTETRSRRQRPLTVGEISSNWQETLREACWIRYYQEEKENPLQMLHTALVEDVLPAKSTIHQNEVEEKNPESSLSISPDLMSILQHSASEPTRNIIVSVYHQSDMDAAANSLKAACLDPVVCETVVEAIHVARGSNGVNHGGTSQSAQVAILCIQRNIVKNILEEMPTPTTLHILEGYYSKLQELVPLYGDHIPRHQGVGKCVVPEQSLQLALCEWSPSCHPNDIAAATMNAWTCTWDKDTFLQSVAPMEDDKSLQ